MKETFGRKNFENAHITAGKFVEGDQYVNYPHDRPVPTPPAFDRNFFPDFGEDEEDMVTAAGMEPGRTIVAHTVVGGNVYHNGRPDRYTERTEGVATPEHTEQPVAEYAQETDGQTTTEAHDRSLKIEEARQAARDAYEDPAGDTPAAAQEPQHAPVAEHSPEPSLEELGNRIIAERPTGPLPGGREALRKSLLKNAGRHRRF